MTYHSTTGGPIMAAAKIVRFNMVFKALTPHMFVLFPVLDQRHGVAGSV
jgi:hypothetical protein